MSLTVKLSQKSYPMARSAIEVGANNIFTTKGAKYASQNHALYSEGASTCLLVALNAGRNNCLMHLDPAQQSVATIENGINKCIKSLKSKCGSLHEKVTALLVGGTELKKNNNECVNSFYLYNTVADKLDEKNIPFTMICGKIENQGNDNIYLVNENANIWNKAIGLPKDATQIEIEDFLKSRYQFVEISPEVPVTLD